MLRVEYKISTKICKNLKHFCVRKLRTECPDKKIEKAHLTPDQQNPFAHCSRTSKYTDERSWFHGYSRGKTVGSPSLDPSPQGEATKHLRPTKQSVRVRSLFQGRDLQNILRQSYDYLTIMPTLRSTYDGCLVYKTSYEECKPFLRYNSLAKL